MVHLFTNRSHIIKLCLVICCSLLISSCSISATKYFINTKRELTACTSSYQAWGLGVASAAIANSSNIESCTKQLKAMGFFSVSEIGDAGMNLSTSGTVSVVGVAENSDAELQGIKVGDQILRVSKQAIQTDNEAYNLLFGDIGTRVEVITLRKSDTLRYSLVRESFGKLWKLK